MNHWTLLRLVFDFAIACLGLFLIARKNPAPFSLTLRLAGWSSLIFVFLAVQTDPSLRVNSLSPQANALLIHLKKLCFGVLLGFFVVRWLEQRHKLSQSS